MYKAEVEGNTPQLIAPLVKDFKADMVRCALELNVLIEEKQISIAIIPDYRYDLWDTNPQGEFSTVMTEGKRLRSLLTGQ